MARSTMRMTSMKLTPAESLPMSRRMMGGRGSGAEKPWATVRLTLSWAPLMLISSMTTLAPPASSGSGSAFFSSTGASAGASSDSRLAMRSPRLLEVRPRS